MMHHRRAVILTAVIILSLLLVPGAAAQETRTGGNIVIQSGEAVQGLTAIGGSIAIQGTVEDDLTVIGGDIAITGNVTGDVTVIGGAIRVPGDVTGDLNAYAGRVELTETGSVGGTVETGAGDVMIHGTVDDDVRVDAERLVIRPTAAIGGELVHSTESLSLSSDASISGDIRSVDQINVARGLPVQTSFPIWLLALYGVLINLLLGAVFLLFLPDFSRDVADTGQQRPLRTLLFGVLALFLTPAVLALIGITIVGLPIAFVGLFIYLFLIWLSVVYGSFTIGTGILERTETMNRWLALIIGLGVVFILWMIPYIGGLILFLVVILGMGALVSAAWQQ
jgi:cytoskeletal protein CcmA (bactofilin family)